MPMEPRAEAWGPPGDPSRHLPLARLEAAHAALPPPPREAAAQLAVIRSHVAAENRPKGTRLCIRAALVEMTPVPHDGCLEIEARVGDEIEALRRA